MIKRKEISFDEVLEANCDCCGESIPHQFGRLGEHLLLSGYHNGKLLEAVVCIKCMKTKLDFINIQKKINTIGYC